MEISQKLKEKGWKFDIEIKLLSTFRRYFFTEVVSEKNSVEESSSKNFNENIILKFYFLNGENAVNGKYCFKFSFYTCF